MDAKKYSRDEHGRGCRKMYHHHVLLHVKTSNNCPIIEKLIIVTATTFTTASSATYIYMYFAIRIATDCYLCIAHDFIMIALIMSHYLHSNA